MTPSVDQRFASVIRSLTDVIMPSLPDDAGLAREQIHMCVAHLNILRSQNDHSSAFEAEEFDDTVALATALVGVRGLAPDAEHFRDALDATLRAGAADPRSGRIALNGAITDLIVAAGREGSTPSAAAIHDIVLGYEGRRIDKDRRWFAPFGFDTLEA